MAIAFLHESLVVYSLLGFFVLACLFAVTANVFALQLGPDFFHSAATKALAYVPRRHPPGLSRVV